MRRRTGREFSVSLRRNERAQERSIGRMGRPPLLGLHAPLHHLLTTSFRLGSLLSLNSGLHDHPTSSSLCFHCVAAAVPASFKVPLNRFLSHTRNGQEDNVSDIGCSSEVPNASSSNESVVGVVDFLGLSERELLLQCKMDTYRASGPGGQHRKKTESTVRLRHLPTVMIAKKQASEDRSQHNNRTLALNRLRQLIAVEEGSLLSGRFLGLVRQPVELEGYKAPPELLRILPPGSKTKREKEGVHQIGPNHRDFVLGLQTLLDLLWMINGSISESATLLGVSTGALSRLIVSDRLLWNAVNNLRALKKLKPLRGT